MPNLRDALDSILNSGNPRISHHPRAIENLKAQHAHSIRHMEAETDTPFNCFAYALGLERSKTLLSILTEDLRRHPPTNITFGAQFVLRLMMLNLLIESAGGPVVVYFRSNAPVHAGRVVSDRIQSKWGIGHLWSHPLWEVPSSYGDTTRYSDLPDRIAVEAEFERYYRELLSSKGGPA